MWPILEVALQPKTSDDRVRLDAALRVLTAGDPTLCALIDRESGLPVLGGVSENHLDRTITAIRETHHVGVNIGQPQVAYRETIARGVQITHTHKHQIVGSGEFAQVTIIFEPAEPNTGYRFDNRVDETILPTSLVAAVEKGLLGAKDLGLLAGFPMIDFSATLVHAKYHDVDSSPLAFEIAAWGAFRQLRDQARPLLVEPIMMVEVATPQEYVGDVIGDLNSRRGMIRGTDQRDGTQLIVAMVPLSMMFGYMNILRSMSQGSADLTMRYDHYESVPQAWPTDPDPDLFPPAAAMRA